MNCTRGSKAAHEEKHHKHKKQKTKIKWQEILRQIRRTSMRLGLT